MGQVWSRKLSPNKSGHRDTMIVTKIGASDHIYIYLAGYLLINCQEDFTNFHNFLLGKSLKYASSSRLDSWYIRDENLFNSEMTSMSRRIPRAEIWELINFSDFNYAIRGLRKRKALS